MLFLNLMVLFLPSRAGEAPPSPQCCPSVGTGGHPRGLADPRAAQIHRQPQLSLLPKLQLFLERDARVVLVQGCPELLPSQARMGVLGGLQHFWWASDPSPFTETSSYVGKGQQGLGQVSAWVPCVGSAFWSPSLLGCTLFSRSGAASQLPFPAPQPVLTQRCPLAVCRLRPPLLQELLGVFMA